MLASGQLDSYWYYIEKPPQSHEPRGPIEERMLKVMWSKNLIDEYSYVWNGTSVTQWTMIEYLPALKDRLAPELHGLKNPEIRKYRDHTILPLLDLILGERMPIPVITLLADMTAEMYSQEDWNNMKSHYIKTNVQYAIDSCKNVTILEEISKLLDMDIDMSAEFNHWHAKAWKEKYLQQVTEGVSMYNVPSQPLRTFGRWSQAQTSDLKTIMDELVYCKKLLQQVVE